MSHAKSSLAQVGSAKVFTKLDPNSGSHKVLLNETPKILTALLKTFGQFSFIKRSPRLSSSPEIYSKVVKISCVWRESLSTWTMHVSSGMTYNTMMITCKLLCSTCEFSKLSTWLLRHMIFVASSKPNVELVQEIQ